MESTAIRQSFLDFFAERGHRVEASAPLVPHGDPTLLFTNAGMVPFKDYFLGNSEPPSRRAVSVQKCMRVSGKHNDLENVGPSSRHHTFFEMLGNFSFGEYFKQEAIRFAWELVTGAWGLDREHLFATVFEEDDEAAELWARCSELPPERILRCGKADNFWAMGDTGPCGPCSEIFVDVSPDQPRVGWQEGTDSGRYLEIWNLVFMQFERHADGEMKSLPNPSIDTGAGLERVAAVIQGVASNYDTDLFQPIIAAAARLAGRDYGSDVDDDVSLRVVADHLRAVTFLLADGVIPGSEGRGYVLRRILRRAVRHGLRLGFAEPFLHRLLPVVREVMVGSYPELVEVEKASVATVEAEEQKFRATVAAGSVQVQAAIEKVRHQGGDELAGDTVFHLYDTLGLPLELVREIAEEERFRVDETGFNEALEAQRKRSRAAGGQAGQQLQAVRTALAMELPPTRYVGYDALKLASTVVSGIVRLGREVVGVAELGAGERGVAVLEATPFYAESGGQVGDHGTLRWERGEGRVTDVQKDEAGIYYHFVEVERGDLAAAAEVQASVDPAWRRPTERNHTATHLLHAALRAVLGPGVRQAGSVVDPNRLRFDFTYDEPLTREQLERVEDLVNDWILQASQTVITDDRPLREALDAGATALFGEKYGDRVRTVEVPPLAAATDGEAVRSLELCGGCHVSNIGQIGPVVLNYERGVASGVRRIEAITGRIAHQFNRQRRQALEEVASHLGVPPERAAAEAAGIPQRDRERDKELARLRLQLVSDDAGSGEAAEVAGIRVLAKEVPPASSQEIRNMADALRDKLGSGVVVLGSRADGKVSLIAAVSRDLTDRLHAGQLASKIAALVDGRGGGRPDFAQAGGRLPDSLPAALEAVAGFIREELADG